MNIFGKYIQYLKDNPKRYWFKRKLYGWGWVPAAWQGWLALVVFLGVFVFLLVSFMSTTEPTDSEVFLFLGKILAWAILLIFLCYLTGEPPKWQWGFPERNTDSEFDNKV